MFLASRSVIGKVSAFLTLLLAATAACAESPPQFGYTARDADGSGLVFYRHRYYDPAVGRFTQRDPLGLAGGLNEYSYVAANPANEVDPWGLSASAAEEAYLRTLYENAPEVFGDDMSAATAARINSQQQRKAALSGSWKPYLVVPTPMLAMAGTATLGGMLFAGGALATFAAPIEWYLPPAILATARWQGLTSPAMGGMRTAYSHLLQTVWRVREVAKALADVEARLASLTEVYAKSGLDLANNQRAQLLLKHREELQQLLETYALARIEAAWASLKQSWGLVLMAEGLALGVKEQAAANQSKGASPSDLGPEK